MADDIINEIEPGLLYITGWRGASDVKELQRLGIHHIVSLNEFGHPPKELRDNPDFDVLYFDIHDRPYEDIIEPVRRANAYIMERHRQNQPVLVHCIAGISRSVSVAIGHLMLGHGYGYEQALQYVQERRPLASPNVGFRSQLRNLHK